MTLTLVAEEPEDNNWENEEITWEANIMVNLGYIETKNEWEDFKYFLCEYARNWMETIHNEKHHGK